MTVQRVEQTYSGTLTQALAGAGISANDHLCLRAGTYAADYIAPAVLYSVAGMEIYIQNYLSEKAIIDGSLFVSGKYIVIKGLEICDLDYLDRETTETGSSPTDIPLRDGLRLENPASNVSVRNCIIHNCRQGSLKDVSVYVPEYYGNLIFYNGWVAPNRGHGHGLYCSNENDTPLVIKDCIVHSNFGYNLHCYGETSNNIAILKNIQVEGCTFFDSGSPINWPSGNIIGGSGVGSTVRTSYMKNCCLKDNLSIGGFSSGCTDFVLQNNVIVGSVNLLYYDVSIPVITGNKFFGTVAVKNGNTGQVVDAPTVFPNNEYLSAFPDHVDLRLNTYDANRAKLTIFNGSSANTVTVDVSAIFGQSGTVHARNVQDYFVDIQTLTITGGSISVNMQASNRTVATPQGWTAPATTFPTFGCFVLVAA
jgi:hypothetical protein